MIRSSAIPQDTRFAIITVNKPVMLDMTPDETWLFNPNRRYVLPVSLLPRIQHYVESSSEFKNSALYNPILPNKDIKGASILVERCRERGIGDLLFMTGPLAFLNNLTGGDVKIHLSALSDRGSVLTHSPLLQGGTVFCGPTEYDHLRNYNYHWFVDSVTETDEEGDQLNVYDALFKQLGYDPADIDVRYKRPQMTLVPEDMLNLHRLYSHVFAQSKIDLRQIPYYVVAPFSNATLRCAPYSLWLKVIKELSTRKPVLVVGASSLRLPDTDMTAGTFISALPALGSSVINAIDATPSVRLLAALISKASLVLTVDSGTLYIAQALRTPTVSLWGTHDPGVRIGYDAEYMKLAVWSSDNCKNSPCYAYADYPVHKCPQGNMQAVCEVLLAATADDVLGKVNLAESGTDVWTKN